VNRDDWNERYRTKDLVWTATPNQFVVAELEGCPPGRAIAEGIARTGRPITNAALIMIVVFVAFGVTGPIPPTELGVTRAMAVLLDATIVRVMLVPATMALLGERNWYLPSWLSRLPGRPPVPDPEPQAPQAFPADGTAAAAARVPVGSGG
jgi:hypothetical protein